MEKGKFDKHGITIKVPLSFENVYDRNYNRLKYGKAPGLNTYIPRNQIKPGGKISRTGRGNQYMQTKGQIESPGPCAYNKDISFKTRNKQYYFDRGSVKNFDVRVLKNSYELNRFDRNTMRVSTPNVHLK